MSYKHNKASCECLNKMDLVNDSKRVNRVTPKKVLTSKKLLNCFEKSCSTGIITTGNNSGKHRNTTKSDVSFSSRYTGKSLDFCKKCGDTMMHASNLHSGSIPEIKKKFKTYSNKSVMDTSKNRKINEEKFNKIKPKDSSRSLPLNQYYKNENFLSTDSIQAENDFRKMSLDTIKELPETRASSNLKERAKECNVYEVYSDSEEIGFLDVDNDDNINNLKKFRDENYFETHSVKSRVDNKNNISVTSLRNHKCVYRFYLNERLFPIPLSTDHQDNVRCVECHLPMDLKMDLDQSNKANGTIQAKVKLSKENSAQDMIIFLPVKNSLIIKERRKQIKEENEVMYFGVIKLDSFGNSVFKSTLPTDSLALKYQKGYREYGSCGSYKYRGIEEDHVIIV